MPQQQEQCTARFSSASALQSLLVILWLDDQLPQRFLKNKLPPTQLHNTQLFIVTL